MNRKEHLQFITNHIVKDLLSEKLLGVKAQWEDETAHITFYVIGELSESEQECVSEACTEIIAQYPTGFLNEEIIFLSPSQKLPPSEYWAYKKSNAI